MRRAYFHLALASLMLVTGSINTLSVKYADKLKSENTAGQIVPFNHPFLQACGMFLGEMLCMVAFYVVKWYKKKRREQRAAISSGIEDDEQRLEEDQEDDSEGPQPTPYNPLIFWPAALCDMTATSIQYIALTLTYASSFQMLRGAVIVFTGILSTFVLRRRLESYRWIGIIFVIIGLSIVGVCDIVFKPSVDPSPNSTSLYANSSIHEFYGVSKPRIEEPSNHTGNEQLIGDVLIVCAQVLVASQMVYEEKVVSRYNVPALQAVGWEGTFGFLTLATLLIPFYFIPVGDKFGNNPRHVLEDAYDGLYQLAHNWKLGMAFSGTVFSIAFFNFAGISVTKEMSATTRMVLDSVRTLVIWGVSLAIGWQPFQALQLLGFAVLVTGMCVYNDILIAPIGRKLAEICRTRYNRLDEAETQPQAPPSSYEEISADS